MLVMLIKHILEDFAVQEITNVRKSKGKSKGRYCYFWLEKKNMTTQDALDKISRVLHAKKIGFAGNKDKRAVTKQLCSVENVLKERLESVRVQGITITFYGYGEEPISLGDLRANRFTIVVRDVDVGCILKKMSTIVNYFDEQRFSEHNVDVGKALVKKNWKRAVEIIEQGHYRYRKMNNDVATLRTIPLKLLQLFVHSYQSKLWNDTVASFIERQVKFDRVAYSVGHLAFPVGRLANKKIPLVGFDTAIKDGKIKTIVDDIMMREQLTFRDFIMREIPELTVESRLRDIVVRLGKFKVSEGNDELFKGKKKFTLSFELPKGSYATMAVKQLFG